MGPKKESGGIAMKQPKISLKMGLLTTIVICWLVPVIIVVTLAAVLLGNSYRSSAQQEMDASAENALRLVQMQLENAIRDSKAVSYDGLVRSAYRDYRQSGDRAALYRSTNDYLTQNFSREELYKAVFIRFWDEDADVGAYLLSSGTTGYDLLRQCRESTPQILQTMADADTEICFLPLDGQLYMARNLLDSSFAPYASVVMMFDPDIIFQSLDAINRISDMRLQIDGYTFILDEQGTLTLTEESAEASDMRYEAEVDGHSFSLAATVAEYNLWEENPWLGWAVLGVALMVLPLMTVVILLFSHHVTKPMQTLAQANLLVQSGHRGYEISQEPPQRGIWQAVQPLQRHVH